MIHPECKNLSKLFISASGQVLPCCYVYNPTEEMNTKWNIHNNSLEFIKKDIEDWISKINTKDEELFGICKYNCAIKKPISDYKLPHLEITSRCTLECPRCPRTINMGKFKIEDLSFEAIVKFIELAPCDKSDRVLLGGNYGDPIYHKDFIKIVKYLHNREQAWRINTNGSHRKISWWEEFYDSYDDTIYSHVTRNNLVFGVDGSDDTSEMYRVNSNFYEVFNAMKLGVKRGKKIIWQFIPFSFNEHQIKEAQKIAEDNGMIFEIRKSDRWYDRYDRNTIRIDPLKPKDKNLFMYKDVNPAY